MSNPKFAAVGVAFRAVASRSLTAELVDAGEESLLMWLSQKFLRLDQR